MFQKAVIWGSLLCLPLAAQAPQLSAPAFNFGAQALGGASQIQYLQVSNPGTAAFTVTGWSVSGAGFAIVSAPAPRTFVPGDSAWIALQFTPTAAGAVTGAFTVATNQGTVAATLTGIGAAPTVGLSGDNNFASQNLGSTSPLHLIYISNPGLIPAQIASIAVSGAGFAIYSETSLPVNLNPGEATGVTVSFTPGVSGTVTGTFAVAGTAAATIPLTGSGVGSNPVSIGTTAVALTLGQPAVASLQASGGTAPYNWSLYWSSGALPPGVSLTAAGQLTGTPTQAGSYAVVVQAGDNSSATNWATQAVVVSVAPAPPELPAATANDAYGGSTAASCSAGPQPHFYTAEIGNRWWLCDPAGNVFWMNGVYNAAATDSDSDSQGIVQADLIASKYATGVTGDSTLNWSLQTVRRLQSWGFNTLAEYAVGWTLPVAVRSEWQTPDQTIPVKLPFVGFVAPSWYSLTNSGGYANQPVKDLMAGVKTSVYSGYRSSTPDLWDANWQQWLEGELANDPWMQRSIHGPNNDYLVGFNVDDTDYMQGFGAGADFPTVSNGVVARGYDQVHLGWVVLVTAETQTSNASLGQTYADPVVYTKRALADFLAARYANNIAALNAAWGSSYTSFGSNGGWGVGSGLLDEDGTCPAAAGGKCWVPSDAFTLAGATAAMQADLDAFLLYDSQQYFSQAKAALNAAAPGVLYLGPTTLGTWGTPPRRQILQAAQPYVDVLMVPSLPPDCSNCNDLQQRIDFVAQYGGNKPWISWEGYQANADSYMFPFATAGDEFTTQAARAAMYAARLQLLTSAADSAGTGHLVGLKWWALYDSRGEQANWGLMTPRDDPYDGKADRPTPGGDAWGYPTGCLTGFGCEQTASGDFLSVVTQANLGVYLQLLSSH